MKATITTQQVGSWFTTGFTNTGFTVATTAALPIDEDQDRYRTERDEDDDEDDA